MNADSPIFGPGQCSLNYIDAGKRIIFEEGPALKFIARKEDTIESLIIETDSPDNILQILKGNSLVVNKTDRGVKLNKGKNSGSGFP